MIIKERPIITWLLNPNDTKAANNITIAPVSIPINRDILDSQLGQLNNLRASGFDWGLPELVMPSFEAVMVKSHSSFEKIMPSLFEEFSVSGNAAYYSTVAVILWSTVLLIMNYIYGVLQNWLVKVFLISILLIIVQKNNRELGF